MNTVENPFQSPQANSLRSSEEDRRQTATRRKRKRPGDQTVFHLTWMFAAFAGSCAGVALWLSPWQLEFQELIGVNETNILLLVYLLLIVGIPFGIALTVALGIIPKAWRRTLLVAAAIAVPVVVITAAEPFLDPPFIPSIVFGELTVLFLWIASGFFNFERNSKTLGYIALVLSLPFFSLMNIYLICMLYHLKSKCLYPRKDLAGNRHVVQLPPIGTQVKSLVTNLPLALLVFPVVLQMSVIVFIMSMFALDAVLMGDEYN